MNRRRAVKRGERRDKGNQNELAWRRSMMRTVLAIAIFVASCGISHAAEQYQAPPRTPPGVMMAPPPAMPPPPPPPQVSPMQMAPPPMPELKRLAPPRLPPVNDATER